MRLRLLLAVLLAGFAGDVASADLAAWSAVVRDGGVPAVAERMRLANGPAWPTIASAEYTAGRPQGEQAELAVRRKLAAALFDKIEALEWGRQRIDDATEAQVVRDYVTVAINARKAGGYHNHVLAETCSRLAMLRLSRWAIDNPARADEARRLLADLQLPILSFALLEELIAQQGLLPAPQRIPGLAPATFPATTRPVDKARTDPLKLSQNDYSAALTTLAGQPPGTQVNLFGEALKAIRTRALLEKANVKLLIMRMDETDRLAVGAVPLLLEFISKGGGFGVNMEQWHDPKGFVGVLKRDNETLKGERFGGVAIGARDINELHRTLKSWPNAPLPMYLTAVDSPPSTAARVDAKAGDAPTIKETPLGELPPNTVAAFSPDGLRWAYAKDGQVRVNGKAHGRRWEKIEFVTLSPAGRLILGVTDNGQAHVVIEDKPGPAFDRFNHIPAENILVFDPTGKRVAYPIRRGNDTFVVVDDKEHGPYQAAYHIQFSATGEHHFHLAAFENGQRVVPVLDGKPLEPLARPMGRPDHGPQLVLSPDASTFAYLERNDKGGNDVVAMGAKALRVPDVYANLAWTPAGQLFAFRATRAFDGEVTLDGKVVHSVKWGGGAPATFSADGNRIWYGGAVLDSDGKSLRPADVPEEQEIEAYFDPAGGPDVIGVRAGRTPYGPGTKYRLRNGQWTKSYGMTSLHRILPDRRFLFSTPGTMPQHSGVLPQMLVIDGVETPQYSGINQRTIVTTPDGKHLVYAAQRNGIWRINPNGVDSTQTYDDIPATGVGMRAPGTFHLLARRENTILSVEITVLQAP